MPRTAVPRPVPRLLIAACVFLFLSGYFVVEFPDVPGASVGSYVFNVLIALPAFVALWRQLGAARAAVALLAVSLFGYFIEGFGVATGLPYGEFHYGDPLGPRAFDLVPFLLPLSYVPLVIGTVAAFAGTGSALRRIIASAILLVVVDGVLDPGAVSLGFWVWPGGGPYYGVPLSNYLGWLISGLLASAILTAVGGRSFSTAAVRPALLDSLIVSLGLWLGVTAFSGLVFPAVLAAVLIAFLIARRVQLARVRRSDR